MIVSKKVIEYGAIEAVIDAATQQELNANIETLRAGMIRNGGCTNVKSIVGTRYAVTIDSGY